MSISADDNSNSSKDYKDLTQESGKRSDGRSTGTARSVEIDDVNEETGPGPVSSPHGDDYGENKVSTSIDDE